MAIHADTMQEALRTITVPQGPALLYITEGDAPNVTILDRAILEHMPKRDQAACRALLQYVIEQLDTDLDGKAQMEDRDRAAQLRIENHVPGSLDDLAARARFHGRMSA